MIKITCTTKGVNAIEKNITKKNLITTCKWFHFSVFFNVETTLTLYCVNSYSD